MVHERSSGEPQLQLCLTRLDELVKDCLPHLSEAALARDTKLRVRALVEQGDIKQALRIIRGRLPELAKDQGFMFKLHKQQFIEILKQGTRNDSPGVLQEALAYARTELAPMALDAYPEAYTEFKQLMQLFVFAGNQGAGQAWPDCTCLFNEKLRQDMAELAYHMVALHTGYHEPRLYHIMAYLVKLYNRHRVLSPALPAGDTQEGERQEMMPPPKRHASSGSQGALAEQQQGGVKHVEDVSITCSKLFLHYDDLTLPVDPSAGPPITSFKDTELQAIMQAAGCNRAKAAAALSRTRNNLPAALLLELNKVMLDRVLLRQLIQEYCTARGLSCPSAAAALAPGDMHEDDDDDDDHQPAHTQHTGGAHKAVLDLSGPRGIPRLHVRRAASRSPPAKMQCNRADEDEGTPFVFEEDDSPGGKGRFAHLHRVTREGGAAALMAEVCQHAPEFWDTHPELTWGVWTAEFRCKLEQADTKGMLSIARDRLAPLAGTDPALQAQLKVLMCSMLPSLNADTPSPSSQLPLMSDQVSRVQEVLANTCGAQGLECMLVRLIRELFVTHKSCMRGERAQEVCQSALDLSALIFTMPAAQSRRVTADGGQPAEEGDNKTGGRQRGRTVVPVAAASPAQHRYARTAQAGDELEAMAVEGQDRADDDDDDDVEEAGRAAVLAVHRAVGVAQESDDQFTDDGEGDDAEGDEDEEVTQVMEILAVTRHQAIALLEQYGDVQSAVNSAFAN